jgi:hypothetical protein
MAEGDLDGGPFGSEKRDVRERGDVRRPMNVIESGSSLFVEMAGKEPANVVSSVMAR